MALGCSSCSATRSLSQWDRIVQRRAGIGIGALLGRRRPESTYCGRRRPRSWTPQLGGKRAYRGRLGKDRNACQSRHSIASGTKPNGRVSDPSYLKPSALPGGYLPKSCLLGNPVDNRGTDCGIRNSQEGSKKPQTFLRRWELELEFPGNGPKDSVAATTRSRSSGSFGSRVCADYGAVKSHSDSPSLELRTPFARDSNK